MRRNFFTHWFRTDRARAGGSQAGFTLVEMLISMGLMAALLTVMTQIFTTITNTRKEAETNSAVSQDSQYLLARLSYDIARASAVTTPSSLGSSSSTLAMTISGSTYTYSVNASNALQLAVSGGSTDNLSDSNVTVSGFTAARYGNGGAGKDTVKLSFTVTSKLKQQSGPTTQTFTLTKGLR